MNTEQYLVCQIQNTFGPKASIAIISYNQENFIAEALEGALSQDYNNLEIVVSDDGSTDGTQSIISEYQARHPGRIVALLNRDNVGITKNSNRALRACTGKYIVLQGGDDILLPQKISKQVAWFEADDRRVLCGHQVEVFHQNGLIPTYIAPKKLVRGNGADLLIKQGGLYQATATMLLASKIPKHGYDEALPVVSDYMMAIEVLSDGGEFGFIEGVHARYRRHDRNVTFSYIKTADDVERTLQIVTNRYPIYQRSCKYALAKHVQYAYGMDFLLKGERGAAIRSFFEAICLSPWHMASWFRLLQTFFGLGPRIRS